jgi:2-(1,2-epoxy-1,2-dihydrophenyl)acetyl-CoA isomerase
MSTSPRGTDALVVTMPRPGVALLEFNRPQSYNALTPGVKRDLSDLLLELQFDDSVRVIVFTGSGRAFCAGDDIKSEPGRERPSRIPELPAGQPNQIRQYAKLRFISQQLIRTFTEIDKPTIAAINGPAVQTGLSIALSCDFRIGAPAARLGSGTLRYAFLPDEGGHYLLVQHLGLGGALDFLLRDRIVDADEALRLGLLNSVVPGPDDLLPAALDLADELCAKPQIALRLLKRSIHIAAQSSADHAMDDIALRASIGDHQEDAADSRAAFREKRKPAFNAWLQDVQGD